MFVPIVVYKLVFAKRKKKSVIADRRCDYDESPPW